MTNDTAQIGIGSCSSCGRTLRAKVRGLRQNMRLTCKCGHVNTLNIDEAILSQHGVIRTPIKEDICQTSGVPLYRLLDGPRLAAKWAEEEAKHAEKWKGLPRESRPTLSDIISVSINLYVLEPDARLAMRALVDRVRTMDKARPWSIELFENVECAITGLLGAPFFVVLGMTEMLGCTAIDNHNAFKEIVRDLPSDDPRAKAGGEWEIRSQNQGNLWRGDRCARLLERWVFLDAGLVETFGARG